MTKSRDLSNSVNSNSISGSRLQDASILGSKISSNAPLIASNKLSFTQAGAGAVSRTVDSKLKDVVSVDDFGAVGDGVTDDLPAFQAAINWVGTGGGGSGRFRGGTVKFGSKRYLLNGTLQMIQRGVTLEGTLPERSEANTQSAINGGVLIGGATNGPVIGMWVSDTALYNVEITSTLDRQNAALSRSPRGSNCGISIEPPDQAGALILRPNLQNVMVRNQPADGIVIQGEVVQSWLENCTVINVKGHLYAVDSGDLTGRSNKSRPGIMNFVNCRGFDAGGHLLAIGHPSSGGQLPYRVFILNFEGFRSCKDPGQRYDDAGWFIFAENVAVISSATSGTGSQTGGDENLPHVATVSVAGRDIQFLSHRFINGTKHVLLRQRSGLTTRMVSFSGGFASTVHTPTPTYLIEAAAGCMQVEVTMVDGDFTEIIDTNLNGMILRKSPNTGGFDVTHRGDIDFQNFGHVRSIRASSADPLVNLNDGEYVELQGAATSTQASGMLRLSQATAALGDASIRMAVGVNTWLAGARRSNNTFCLANSTGFNSSANILNVLPDGSGNGLIGIGPTTITPAHRVDVEGSVNVRAGGAYRVAGLSVVQSRQSPIVNATSGTEVATINSILTALRAHGLIAP